MFETILSWTVSSRIASTNKWALLLKAKIKQTKPLSCCIMQLALSLADYHNKLICLYSLIFKTIKVGPMGNPKSKKKKKKNSKIYHREFTLCLHFPPLIMFSASQGPGVILQSEQVRSVTSTHPTNSLFSCFSFSRSTSIQINTMHQNLMFFQLYERSLWSKKKE